MEEAIERKPLLIPADNLIQFEAFFYIRESADPVHCPPSLPSLGFAPKIKRATRHDVNGGKSLRRQIAVEKFVRSVMLRVCLPPLIQFNAGALIEWLRLMFL